jgi:hypothetical protein
MRHLEGIKQGDKLLLDDLMPCEYVRQAYISGEGAMVIIHLPDDYGIEGHFRGLEQEVYIRYLIVHPDNLTKVVKT